MTTRSWIAARLLAVACLVWLSACGDDTTTDDDTTTSSGDGDTTGDGDGDTTGDGDGDGDCVTDRGRPCNTSAGNITVQDMFAPQLDARGLLVTSGYSDGAPAGTVTFDTVEVNGLGIPIGCSVTEFDFGNGENRRPRLDEGLVIIDGPGLRDLGECRLQEFDSVLVPQAANYGCYKDYTADPATDVFELRDQEGGGQASFLVLAGASFIDDDVVEGDILEVEGATSEGNNGGWIITEVVDANTLKLIPDQRPIDGLVAEEAIPAATTLRILAAQGAVFEGQDSDAIPGSYTVTISKEEGDLVPAFGPVPVQATGQGLALDNDSSQFDALPLDGSDPQFSCSGDGGNCGEELGAVRITVFNGQTTDIPLDELGASRLSPVTRPAINKFVQFQCTFQDDDMPSPDDEQVAGLMDAILASNPTRIESRFFKHVANPVGTTDTSQPANPTNLLAGHGLVGWTDVPAE